MSVSSSFLPSGCPQQNPSEHICVWHCAGWWVDDCQFTLPSGYLWSPVSHPTTSPSFYPKSGPVLLHKSHELLSDGQGEKKRILFLQEPVRGVYLLRTIPDHIPFQTVTEIFPLLQVALVLTFHLFQALYKFRESMILSFGTHFFPCPLGYLWAVYVYQPPACPVVRPEGIPPCPLSEASLSPFLP